MMSTFRGGGVYEAIEAHAVTPLQPTLACLLSECFQDNPLVIRLAADSVLARDLSSCPRVIADPGFHRGRNSQGLMRSDEVVIHEPNRY